MSAKNRGTDAADAVRSAVDRTFQATVGQAQVTRGRAQEIVDELAQATSRVRDVLDDLRVATGDDVKELRAESRDLRRRVSALERRIDEAPAARRARSAKPASKGGAKRASASKRPARAGAAPKSRASDGKGSK